MDRVFDNAGRTAATTSPLPPAPHPRHATAEEPIEVEVREPHRILQQPWQIGGLELPARISLAIAASLGCLTLLGGVSLWQGWSEARNDLRQERNLRLLEGIRSLGTTPEATSSSGTDSYCGVVWLVGHGNISFTTAHPRGFETAGARLCDWCIKREKKGFQIVTTCVISLRLKSP